MEKLYLGVDLGGTKIAAGLLNGEELILQSETPTLAAEGQSAVIERIVALCRDLIEKAPAPVAGVGVGVPGAVRKGGFVADCPNLGWENVPLAGILEEKLGLPVFIGNDANCAALAEVRLGAAKGCENCVLLTLGTGVGGGLILNGKIYDGRRGFGGEVGHMLFAHEGEICGCGNHGCLERYCAAPALARYAGVQTPREVIASLLAGEDRFAPALEKYVACLGAAVASLVNLLDPDMVLLGGGVCVLGERLTVPAARIAKGRVLVQSEDFPPVALAKLGNAAGLLGAALLPVVEK